MNNFLKMVTPTDIDILADILARMSVSVSMSVSWNAGFTD